MQNMLGKQALRLIPYSRQQLTVLAWEKQGGRQEGEGADLHVYGPAICRLWSDAWALTYRLRLTACSDGTLYQRNCGNHCLIGQAGW
jgi:hypothetical protein